MLPRVFETNVLDCMEAAVEFDSTDYSSLYDAFVRRAVELGPPDGEVLDCGARTGRTSILLAQDNAGLRITGIDPSVHMIKVAEVNIAGGELTDRIMVQHHDSDDLPFPDNHFDMVISNCVVHHMADPLLFLQRLNRVIKPNAAILIWDFIRPDFTIDVEILVRKYMAEGAERQQRQFREALRSSLTVEEVEAMVDASGIQGTAIVQLDDRYWSIERKWYRELKKDFPLTRGS